MQALARSEGFVRHELAPRLGLREMPGVRFVLDTSIERGARVEELLRRIADGEPIPDEDDVVSDAPSASSGRSANPWRAARRRPGSSSTGSCASTSRSAPPRTTWSCTCAGGC